MLDSYTNMRIFHRKPLSFVQVLEKEMEKQSQRDGLTSWSDL